MSNFLSVENLTCNYGEMVLFENISFGVSEGQKVALIARNGAGKTSLFNIITGYATANDGIVSFRKGIEVGYLAQEPELNPEHTIIEELFNSRSEVAQTVKLYEAALDEGRTDDLSELAEKMDRLNAWDYENRIHQIFGHLKIHHLNQKINELSGGQRKRVALAKVLIGEPDFLFLDEPTNHLDLSMIEWLEQYLGKSRSTLLMITHDRYFLDRVCNHIIEIDNQSLYQYQGNYSYYLEKREERIASKSLEIEKARNLMKKEQDWMSRQPQARGTKAKYRIDAFYDLKDVAGQKLDNRDMDLTIKGARLGNKILEIYNVSKGYDQLKLITDFSYKFMPGEKIGIIGQNGTGKTTFLKLITGALAPDKGRVEIGETVVMGYYKQEGLVIDDDKRVIDVITDIADNISLGEGQSMSATQFLRHFLFPSEMHYSLVRKLSGGERKRLHLMTVLMKNPNFLILDEPTNDLDIFTLGVLEDYLKRFAGCVIVVSHDRFFMDNVVDHVFAFQGDGVMKDFPGNYTEYTVQRAKLEKQAQVQKPAQVTKKPEPVKAAVRKLTYKEKQEIEQIEKEMTQLEKEKTTINAQLSLGTLNSEELVKHSNRIGEVMSRLDDLEMRWLELSEIGQ